MATTVPTSSGGATDEKDAPVSSYFDALVTELESSEGQLGATLRAVYDESKQNQFLQLLETRIRQHDKDIERMCNHHYQGFIESVNELLKVGADARRLKMKLQSANGEFQDAGSKLVKNGDELISLRTIQRNIAAAMESLTFCRPVLELYAKLKEQMKERRYYPALKTLEQLEHTYLPRVNRYSINQAMRERIPKLRENIKGASMTDLRNFLEDVRAKSEKIGMLAMKQTQYRGSLDLSKRNTTDTSQKQAVDLDTSVQDMVDFSPIYRCMHIFTVLGERETFEGYYHRQRWHQARLVLDFPSTQVSMQAYRSYFYQVAGFFVVEDTVLNTTQGLITKHTVNELWELAVSKIASALRTHTSLFSEVQMVRSVKELVVLFCETLQSFDFQVSQLYDLLLETREQYSELLMRTWYTVIKNIFAVDNYTPMRMEAEEDLQVFARSFPLEDVAIEESYPQDLPFSEFVPMVYGQIKEFIHKCAGFAENLNLSHTETDEMVRKSTNLLLTRTVAACFSELIHDDRLRLSQLVQLSVNTTYLEKACEGLSSFIANTTGVSSDTSMLPRIYGVSCFTDARADSEDQIYTRLQQRIDEFFELSQYQWMSPEVQTAPSSHMDDLLAFLGSTFLSLTSLPDNVCMTACMSSCKHIARRLFDIMVTEEGPFNQNGLRSFAVDVKRCEEFAVSLPLKGIDGTYQLAFGPIRQMVDLFINMDWSAYLADYGTGKSRYPRVRPTPVARVLCRFREKEAKRGLLSGLRSGDRDRRRLLETIVKRLWELDPDNRGPPPVVLG